MDIPPPDTFVPADNALLQLSRGLKALHDRADAIPEADHDRPQLELARQAEELFLFAQAHQEVCRQALPPAPANAPASATVGAEETAFGFASADELRREQDLRFQLDTLVRDLGETPELLRSGCDHELRPRMLCYVPLLDQLSREAAHLGALL